MGVSDRIEAFINELLKDEAPDQWLELKRNELASVFNCVPSQINYVISTRFNTERGYVVESRRGGGGYLRIKRINAGSEHPIVKAIQSIGESIDYPTARSYIAYLSEIDALDKITAMVIINAVSDNSLTIEQPEKDKIRANILKNALTAAI
ncbi:MAG: CtsR family transcriptional regulator [Clostridia bacterium]|nr:CtsR family transcriptional regulator [Clostridia bacterium]